jgi:hypothetical protein
MKELLTSKLGKIAVRIFIWSLVGVAIAAGGNALLFFIMDKTHTDKFDALFAFIYGTFYCIGMASFYLIYASVITLLVMIIVKYGKRRFCKN